MDNAAIERMIADFIASYSQRRKVETIWRKPLVGFASAEDPIFDQFKEIIRPTHATPREVLRGAKSVEAYFVPFSKERLVSQARGIRCRDWRFRGPQSDHYGERLHRAPRKSRDGSSFGGIAPFQPRILSPEGRHRLSQMC